MGRWSAGAGAPGRRTRPAPGSTISLRPLRVRKARSPHLPCLLLLAASCKLFSICSLLQDGCSADIDRLLADCGLELGARTYSPQSSPSSGAGATCTGFTPTTSSSTPHSGQTTISPTSTFPASISPPHSGHATMVSDSSIVPRLKPGATPTKFLRDQPFPVALLPRHREGVEGEVFGRTAVRPYNPRFPFPAFRVPPPVSLFSTRRSWLTQHVH